MATKKSSGYAGINYTKNLLIINVSNRIFTQNKTLLKALKQLNTLRLGEKQIHFYPPYTGSTPPTHTPTNSLKPGVKLYSPYIRKLHHQSQMVLRSYIHQ